MSPVAATGLMALAPLLAAAQAQPAAPVSRGQLLYDMHCIACHTTQMHWREQKQVTDWPSLTFQVRRWQASAQLNWTEADIDDVARHLNDSIYRLPARKVAGLAPARP